MPVTENENLTVYPWVLKNINKELTIGNKIDAVGVQKEKLPEDSEEAFKRGAYEFYWVMKMRVKININTLML